MSTPRQYELIFIVSPDVGETEVTDLHNQVQEIVSSLDGKIEQTENWGSRKLAYEIGSHKEGTYLLDLISGPAELVKELDRKLRVIEQVIRHSIIRVDEDRQTVERIVARRKANQQKNSLARGLPPEPESEQRQTSEVVNEDGDRLEG